MAYQGAKALAVAVSILLAHSSASAASNKSDQTSTWRHSAIIGGDTNAIIGGDRQKAKRPSAIIGGDIAAASDLRIIANGPVDYVDDALSRVQVLGQEFVAKASSPALRELSSRVASGEVITATVYGRLSSDGTLKPHAVMVSNQQHVPGVTRVMVAGELKGINPERGTFVIGGLTVDYTPLLADGTIELAVGSTVEVTGFRYSRDGVLTATTVQSL
jgi:hypothetical protein